MRHGNIGYLVQRQHTPFTCCSSTNTMIPASPVAVLPLKHTTPSARKLPRPRIPLLPYSSRPSGTALSIDLSTCIRIRIQLIYHYYCIVPTNHKPPLGCAGWRPLFHFNTASRAGAKKHRFPPCHLPVPRDALALLRAHTIETLHGWWGRRSPILLRHASYCSSRIAASVLVLCARHRSLMSPVLFSVLCLQRWNPLSSGKQSGKTAFSTGASCLVLLCCLVLTINVNTAAKPRFHVNRLHQLQAGR